MQIRLRTLLLVLAIGPLALAANWFKESWTSYGSEREIYHLGSIICLFLIAMIAIKLCGRTINRFLFGPSDDNRPEPEGRMIRLTFRFTIRDLLLFMLVICVGLGWFFERRRIAERRIALENIGAILRANRPQPTWRLWLLGNDAPRYSEEIGFGGTLGDRVPAFYFAKTAEIGGKQVTEALVYFRGLTQLKSLTLTHTQITDSGLVHLRGLIQLRELWLDKTQITDAGLVNFKRLTHLEQLALDLPQITNAGLEHVEGLTELKGLYLATSQVSDDGLIHLKGLTGLQTLFLSGTQVSDAGLIHLKGLTQLQELWLGGTQVTDAGINDLQKALPNTWINRKWSATDAKRDTEH